MNAAEVSGLLDAHDALVRSGVDGDLPFSDFVLAYGDFPGGYGIAEDAPPHGRAILPLFRRRIAFHRQVAGVLSGFQNSENAGFRQNSENAVADDLRVFLQRGIMLRLRALVSRFPEFATE